MNCSVDKTGNIALSNSLAKGVTVVSKTGNKISQINIPNLFFFDINAKNDEIIASFFTGESYVALMDVNGKIKWKFNLQQVRGVRFTSEGNIVTVTLCEVFILDKNGNIVKQFGSEGKRNGELSRPVGVDEYNGKIVVAEFGNDRVQVFDKNGNFQCKSTETMARPEGVCFDGEGKIIVGDRDNNMLLIYNDNLQLIQQFQMNENPVRVCVDEVGNIICCTPDRIRLQISA